MEEHIAETQKDRFLPRFAWILKGPARGPRPGSLAPISKGTSATLRVDPEGARPRAALSEAVAQR